jgi:hypothetical protein
LLELLIATSIMSIMAGVLGALALSVQMHSAHSQGHGEAVQHARVVLDRMQRTLTEAHASEQFPAFVAFADTVGTYKFPDVLVVWNPATTAASPAGLPRWSEVVVFCPDLDAPNTLLEIRAPSDTRAVPALSDTATWRAELLNLRQSNSVERVELTNLLRTASTGGDGPAQLRAALRFDVQKRPSDEDWADFRDGDLDWDELPWVQGIYGTRTGLRQIWCRIELQLTPGNSTSQLAANQQSVLTFFGTAAVYHELRK